MWLQRELETSAEKHSKAISELQAVIDQRQGEDSSLAEDLESANCKIRDLDEELASKKECISTLEMDLSESSTNLNEAREALAEFWGIRQGILPRAAARVVVAQKRESDGANAWPQSEREFIADLFESAHANARLPFLGHARRNLQLPACIGP